MFWGLILKANRKYTQTTSKSFHISQAALDSSTSNGSIQIFLTYENQKYLICTLCKDTCEQVSLDLNFAAGDDISFQSQGNGCVHLSGYLTDLHDPMDYEESEEESEVEEADLRAELNKKSKKKNRDSKPEKTAAKANSTAVAAEDDESEDDSDLNGELGEGEDDDDAEAESDDEEEEDNEEEDDSEDEEVHPPKGKKPKLDKPKQNGATEQKDAGKKDKKEKKEGNAQQRQAAGGERTITGGVKIEEIRVGNGPEAKSGKKAQVYYEGRLKSTNKVFDSMKQGSGFKFGVGRGEVIKAWDVGVVGMKVGGKRRITCPPHMAYGARGAPPQIPPNSTLVFEVELKGVN